MRDLNLFSVYIGTARWAGLLAPLAVLLVGLTAVLEGSALMTLYPLLAKASGGGTPPIVSAVLGAVGLERVDVTIVSLLAFLFVGTCALVLRYQAERYLLKLRIAIEREARERMTRALLNMPWERYTLVQLGDIGKSVIVEGSQIGLGTQSFIFACGLCLATAGYLVLIFLLSPWMTLLVLAFALIGLASYVGITGRARHHVDHFSALVTVISQRANDIFGNAKFFRATGLVDQAYQRAAEIYGQYATRYIRGALYGPMNRAALEAETLLFIACFLFVSLEVRSEPIPAVAIFLAIFLRMAPRLGSIHDSVFQARSYLSWYESWRARYEMATAAVPRENGQQSAVFEKQVQLDNVSVLYPARAQRALECVTLSIRKNTSVAIVGPSGGGKSTVIDLITGLIKPNDGHVRVDGKDLESLDLQAWQKRIGLVQQDNPVFPGTVYDNIAFGTDVLDRPHADECARQAGLKEAMDLWPEGGNLEVGEKGSRLSGGERQRLGFARALYRRPSLLLLDEASSSLDGATEEQLVQTAKNLKGVVTMLIVSHRLKLVADVDQIFVLEDGRVVEEGTWPDLMAKRGRFWQMAIDQGRTT